MVGLEALGHGDGSFPKSQSLTILVSPTLGGLGPGPPWPGYQLGWVGSGLVVHHIKRPIFDESLSYL